MVQTGIAHAKPAKEEITEYMIIILIIAIIKITVQTREKYYFIALLFLPFLLILFCRLLIVNGKEII